MARDIFQLGEGGPASSLLPMSASHVLIWKTSVSRYLVLLNCFQVKRSSENINEKRLKPNSYRRGNTPQQEQSQKFNPDRRDTHLGPVPEISSSLCCSLIIIIPMTALHLRQVECTGGLHGCYKFPSVFEPSLLSMFFFSSQEDRIRANLIFCAGETGFEGWWGRKGGGNTEKGR